MTQGWEGHVRAGKTTGNSCSGEGAGKGHGKNLFAKALRGREAAALAHAPEGQQMLQGPLEGCAPRRWTGPCSKLGEGAQLSRAVSAHTCTHAHTRAHTRTHTHTHLELGQQRARAKSASQGARYNSSSRVCVGMRAAWRTAGQERARGCSNGEQGVFVRGTSRGCARAGVLPACLEGAVPSGIAPAGPVGALGYVPLHRYDPYTGDVYPCSGDVYPCTGDAQVMRPLHRSATLPDCCPPSSHTHA